jgi:YggT family protein
MTGLYVFLDVVRYLCYVFGMLIVIRSLLSWLSPRPGNVLVTYLTRVTEPLLAPVRRILPRTGIVDLSPLAVILILYLLSWLLGLFY